MANYKVSLKDYIKNVKNYRADPIKYCKPIILELIYAILVQIGKYTITDTAQARGSVIKAFADKYFNSNYQGLDQEVYRYWEDNGYPENASRDFNNEKTVLRENTSTNNFNLTLSIDDEGLYAQEYARGSKGGSVGGYNGNRYPSIKVDGRDNSGYKIRHISYVSDLINSGEFGAIEDLDFKKLVDKLAEYIEKYIFTGQVN